MQFRDIVLAILIAAVWGFNFLASKWAVADFPPMLANALRFMIVLVILAPFLRWVPGKMKQLALAAVLLGVLHFGLLFWGMKLSDGVGSVSIASQLNVPFSTILAILILKETVGWRRVAGISISFLGVVVLSFDPVIFSYWDGVMAVIAAAFVYAVAAVLMRQLKDVPAATTQGWVAVAAIAGSVVVSVFVESGQIDSIRQAGSRAWMAVAYTAIASSLIGHGGANYLFRKYEVSMVSPYFLVMPFFSVASGVLFLGETIGWEMALGGFLTISGVLIVTLRNNERARLTRTEKTSG